MYVIIDSFAILVWLYNINYDDDNHTHTQYKHIKHEK